MENQKDEVRLITSAEAMRRLGIGRRLWKRLIEQKLMATPMLLGNRRYVAESDMKALADRLAIRDRQGAACEREEKKDGQQVCKA